MTLEEVIESPALWEALTPQEQEAFFAPYLNVTRPDRESAIHKDTKKSVGEQSRVGRMSKHEKLFASLSKEKQAQMKLILDEEGIEL